MAAEPQPSEIQEGAPTGTVEDRKAAAALSSLDAQDDDSAGKKNVDTKALGEAMKNLSVDGKDSADDKKKAVKVDAQDVALLVAELELPKQKATELLRTNEGDAVQAMTAYVAASG